MKNEFDSFDDIVKRKMDNTEFAFNENNWAKAAEMIDASRKPLSPVVASNTKYFVLGGSIAAGIILLLGTVYFFNNFKVLSNEEFAQLKKQNSVEAEMKKQINYANIQITNKNTLSLTAEENEEATSSSNANLNNSNLSNSESVNTSEKPDGKICLV